MKEKSSPMKKHRKRVKSLLRFDLTEKQRRDYADAGYYYPGHGEELKCIHLKESVPINRLRERCQVLEDSQNNDEQNTLKIDEYDTENITECNSVGSNIVDNSVPTCAQVQEFIPLNIKQPLKRQDLDALRSTGGSRTTGAVPWDDESVDFVIRDGKGCSEEENIPHPEKSLDSNAETKTSQEKEQELQRETPSENIPNKQGAEKHALTDRHKENIVQKCEETIQQGDDKEMANLSKCRRESNSRGPGKKKGSTDFCSDVFCKINLIDLSRNGCVIRDVSTGLKPTVLTSAFAIFLILGVQITDVNSNSSCLDKQKEYSNSVESCPKTAEEWNKRAEEKKCYIVSALCSNDSMLEYHCVLRPRQDGLVEVCAKVWNSIGYCIEWNENGLQDNYDLDCTNYSTPCPSFYFSNTAYKYQKCYEMQNTTSDQGSYGKNTSTNANDPKNSSDERSSSLILIILLTIFILFVLGILSICLIRREKKRKSKLTEKKRRQNLDEEQTLKMTDKENTESDV